MNLETANDFKKYISEIEQKKKDLNRLLNSLKEDYNHLNNQINYQAKRDSKLGEYSTINIRNVRVIGTAQQAIKRLLSSDELVDYLERREAQKEDNKNRIKDDPDFDFEIGLSFFDDD